MNTLMIILCLICTTTAIYILHIYAKSNSKHIKVIDDLNRDYKVTICEVNHQINQFELISKHAKTINESMKSEMNRYADIVKAAAAEKAKAPHPMEIFIHGNQNMINMIDVALYRMSEEGELFGFENIAETLRKTLIKFNDPNEMNSWKDKFTKYKKKSEPQAGEPNQFDDGFGEQNPQ